MATFGEAQRVALEEGVALSEFGKVDNLEVVLIDGSYVVKASFAEKNSLPENFFIGPVRVVTDVPKEEGPKNLHHEPAEQALETPDNVDEPPTPAPESPENPEGSGTKVDNA
jgi:hypothetical protein